MSKFSGFLAAALLGASATIVGVGHAAAGEKGSFSAVMGFTADYTSIEFADGSITGGPLRGPATITRSTGAPFIEGESGQRTCIVFSKQTSAGVELQAPCTVTDSSGDKLYMLAIRTVGDVAAGGGGTGTQQIMGGTGKYAGMSGTCEYTVNYLPDNMGVTRTSCEWQKP